MAGEQVVPKIAHTRTGCRWPALFSAPTLPSPLGGEGLGVRGTRVQGLRRRGFPEKVLPVQGVCPSPQPLSPKGRGAFETESKSHCRKDCAMADIRAFRAFRYDLGRVGTLGDVIAPPYDVIDPALQDALYRRSPYNVVRLILNKEEPGDNDNSNRYTRAAACLRDWQREGVLVQDSARALYVYHQDFEVEGKRYTRRGFMARARLEPFGQGKVFPHEETLAGPKADRLKLFRATAMNLSQIFGLYPDADGAVQA